MFTNIFKSFRYLCPDIHELDSVRFLTAQGLARQAALKKTKVKLELLIGIDMLLMVENDVRGGARHAIDKCMANNKS